MIGDSFYCAAEIDTYNILVEKFFVGVFQYNLGPQKHALELRDYVKYMFSLFIINNWS